MGDPRKQRRKYKTPGHPWVGSRITEERTLKRDYGLRNKAEIWKMDTTIKQFKDRAKQLLARTGEQADLEREQMISKMARLGLISKSATFDDILGLDIKSLMERRLQSLLLQKHLARTPKQARQMITHRHITVNGSVVTSPSYLVTVEEEASIAFIPRSAFAADAHPERITTEELELRRAKEEAKQKKVETQDDAPLTFDEKDIEEAEVLTGEKLKSEVKAEEKSDAEQKESTPTDAAPEKTEKTPTPEEKPAEKAATPEKSPEKSTDAKPAEAPKEMKKEPEKPAEKEAKE